MCPMIARFWKAILNYLEDALVLPNIYSPARCLLGDLEEERISTSQKITENTLLLCQESGGSQMEGPGPSISIKLDRPR